MQNIQQIQIFFEQHPAIFIAMVAWSLTWKGIALWKAARLSHKRWFIAMLILNTVGILDIIYLYFVAKKYTVVSSSDESLLDKSELEGK